MTIFVLGARSTCFFLHSIIFILFRKVIPSFFAIFRTAWSKNTKTFFCQIRRYENNWSLLTDIVLDARSKCEMDFLQSIIFILYRKVIPSFFPSLEQLDLKIPKYLLVKSDAMNSMKIIDLYWQILSLVQQDPWPRWKRQQARIIVTVMPTLNDQAKVPKAMLFSIDFWVTSYYTILFGSQHTS